MSRTPPPASRKSEILHVIVETYIETGEPVASRLIARRMKGSLSPATIRNVMADLYEEGLLAQPHTSAGRIPTERAFQSFIKSLAARRIILKELEILESQFLELPSMQDRVERSSQILTEMTRGMGIAAAIPSRSHSLHHVDFLSLGDRRVLMVVVTSDHAVHNKVVLLGEEITLDELSPLRNYLNTHFAGWPISDVRRELERRLAEEHATYDAILKRLQVLYANGLLEVETAPEVHMEGVSNLLGLDMHLTREKMRDLFRALEQKKKILQLLEQFLEQPQGELAVQVGLSEAHPSMGELALIGVNVLLPSGLAGKLAVIGPIRMNYQRCMSAVLQVGQALQNSPR